MANFIKKSIVAGVLVSASSVVSAATLTAGGIEWDTVPINGAQGTTGTVDFQQWFSDGSYGVGADGQSTVTASSNGSVGVGPGGYLTGVGLFSGLSDGRGKDDPSFCVDGDDSCELTFAFGGLLSLPDGSFDSSNAWLNVYFDNSPDFGRRNSLSYQKYGEAQDGDLWASFDITGFSYIPFDPANPFDRGGSDVFLNIVGGNSDVIDIFDNGSLLDIFFTASAQFRGAEYSAVGTGEISTVSTPATLGLFGLALFGLGVASRKRIAK